MAKITKDTIVQQNENITDRRALFFTQEGIIKASGGGAQGKPFTYTKPEEFYFKVVNHLLAIDCKAKRIETVIEKLRTKGDPRKLFKPFIEGIRAGTTSIFLVISTMRDETTIEIDVISSESDRSSVKKITFDMFGVRRSIVLSLTDEVFALF